MYGRARFMNDELFQLRRHSFIAFYLLLAIHVCTSFDIGINENGTTEVLATLPICTLCFAFTTFIMLSSAYFGRKHHHNFFIWFFLLQYPAIMLIIHLFTRYSDKYVRVFSIDDLLFYEGGEMHLIVEGRLTLLAVVIVCFFFMLGMLVDSYNYYLRKKKDLVLTNKTKIMRRDEITDIALYAALFIGMLVTFVLPVLLPHIIFNILMTAMITRTYYVYSNFMHYSEHHSRKILMFADIDKEISFFIDRERNNPLYQSKSNIEDIASLFNVDVEDFRDYLNEKVNTNFYTWMSELRMMHFCNELTYTNRKISELSVACGYNNASSLSRAFKIKYGMTPSEWRDKKQTTT